MKSDKEKETMQLKNRLSDKDFKEKAYQFAVRNTKYNSEGRVVISKGDEWLEEVEWDDLFEQIKKKRVSDANNFVDDNKSYLMDLREKVPPILLEIISV